VVGFIGHCRLPFGEGARIPPKTIGVVRGDISASGGLGGVCFLIKEKC